MAQEEKTANENNNNNTQKGKQKKENNSNDKPPRPHAQASLTLLDQASGVSNVSESDHQFLEKVLNDLPRHVLTKMATPKSPSQSIK